jgi:hypothetical protein
MRAVNAPIFVFSRGPFKGATDAAFPSCLPCGDRRRTDQFCSDSDSSNLISLLKHQGGSNERISYSAG